MTIAIYRKRRAHSLALVLLTAIACGVPGDRRVGGASPPAGSTGTAAPTVGGAVPVYRGMTVSGASLSVGGQSDSVTLLNVWATWCTSCREEMQDLERIRRTYEPNGVRVVAVSVDAGSDQLVRHFVQDEHLAVAVVHDADARFQRAYHVAGVPSTYLIGRDGRLLWQRTGGIHGATEEVRAALSRAVGLSVPSGGR